MRAHRLTVAEVVVPLDVLVPQPGLLLLLDQLQAQRLQLPQTRLDPRLGIAAPGGVRPYELAALSAATAPHSTSEELPLHIASRYPPIPRIEFAFWDA